MDEFDRVSTIFYARIDEIRGNLRVRKSNSFFVKNNAELFAYGTMPGRLKGELSQALNLKNAPENVAYRGLILQLYGSFERLITEITEATLSAMRARTTRYSELSEALRNAHTVGSARLLAKLHDRNINGVPFDFDSLQRNMAACFADDPKYRLGAEAFTALLGVCTPDRVDSLFEALRLGKAFDDTLGRDSKIKSWAKNAGAREALKLARDSLEDLVRLRNQIAHGSADTDILDSQVEEAAEFLSALGAALIAKARAIAIPPSAGAKRTTR